jgi:hypothetical protein
MDTRRPCHIKSVHSEKYFKLWNIKVIVRGVFFFLSPFVYICMVVGDPIIKRGDWDWPLTSLSPPHVCACHKPGPGFRTPYILVFSRRPCHIKSVHSEKYFKLWNMIYRIYHLSPKLIEHEKDQDIWRSKSRSWLVTGTNMWRT